MVVTQSKNLVRCPKCEEIKKATGEKYFICCRTRWDLETHRLDTGNEEDSNSGHNQANSKETGRSRESGDQSQSNDKTRSNQSGKSGEESGGKTLEF